MTAPNQDRAAWTIQEAERLLMSLKGVVSARVVGRPGGGVDEIHMLTTSDVKPKATVRNVESALMAHLDLGVDHRKISVAQTTGSGAPLQGIPEPLMPVQIVPDIDPPTQEQRFLFYGHQVETHGANHVKHRVEIEWDGDLFVGEARAADLPRPKLEAVASATLQAIEAALSDRLTETRRAVTLSLEGVKLVEAFDRRFVLVAVHAIAGRNVSRLSGTAVADDSQDRATILATLQATDRWVRGRAN